MKVVWVRCSINSKGMDVKTDEIEVKDGKSTFSYKSSLGGRRINKSDMLKPYSLYKSEVSSKCFATYAHPEDVDRAKEIVTNAALIAFKDKYNEVMTIASALISQSITLN